MYHHIKSTAAITGHLLLVLQLLQAIDIVTPASVIRCANGEYAEFEQLCGANAKTDQMQSESCSGDNCINGRTNQPESVGKKCIQCVAWNANTETGRQAIRQMNLL